MVGKTDWRTYTFSWYTYIHTCVTVTVSSLTYGLVLEKEKYIVFFYTSYKLTLIQVYVGGNFLIKKWNESDLSREQPAQTPRLHTVSSHP